MVPRLTYFYIYQVSTNRDVLFILCWTTNDPKFSGLQIQLFYYISQFMGHDFRQGSAGSQAGLRVLGCHHLNDWLLGDSWAALDTSPLLCSLGTFPCGLSSRGAGLLPSCKRQTVKEKMIPNYLKCYLQYM